MCMDGVSDLTEEGDGRGGDDGAGRGGDKLCGALSVPCSICLDVVQDNGDRSWAKLRCGHRFHLDCIGSAFNIKGAMQCPNCRKIEKGQWHYANSCRPEFSMGVWNHDEDLYDLNHHELAFGVHWCPFGGLARLPFSFDGGDLSSTAYHDLVGQHAMFVEHAAGSSTSTHPCPYMAYLGPMLPSSSNVPGRASDGPNLHNHWNGATAPSDPRSYTFPGMDLHYQSWEHRSSPFPTSSGGRMPGGDRPSVPSPRQRFSRAGSDAPRSSAFAYPFLAAHPSSGGRAGGLVASAMAPYSGINVRGRARDRVQSLQAYYQQQLMNSSTGRGNGDSRGTGSSSGFYLFPSSASIRHSQEQPEHRISAHFPRWERDQYGDSGWRALYHDSGTWPGVFHRRDGSDR